MNILYINHYAGSLTYGMEYRPYYLAREWVRLGHNVTIIASNISHLRMHITIPEGQNYLVEYIDGIRYVWCRTPDYPGNGIKRVINIFNFLRRVKKLIPAIIKGKNIPDNTNSKFDIPDLVIASSTYPFDTKVASKIAKKTGAKFVYEVHDLWPLTPIELNGMSKIHPFIMLMQRAEDFGYRVADKVVSLLPKAKSYMVEHGLDPNKFVYIPNGVSVADWEQVKESVSEIHLNKINEIKQQYGFLLGYAGGMGESNALDFLLTAAKQLDKNIAVVLIGNGAKKDALLKRVTDENITNVFILPAISKAQIPDFLSRMDSLYIGWNKLSIYRFGICPNKLFDYMLSGKPVVHSVTAGNDLVADAKCGVSVEAESVTAIIKAINMIAVESKVVRDELGENGYEYVKIHHDYKVLAKRFLDETI